MAWIADINIQLDDEHEVKSLSTTWVLYLVGRTIL